MKIREVERLVGVSRVNIRFYEREGLLAPARNSANGYRDYSEADVERLKQIKLLRKLDVPMEEIRRLQSGALTLSDAMERHLVQLRRSQANLETMQAICAQLRESRCGLDELDVDGYLRAMEERERGGASFVNIKKRDTASSWLAPVAAALFIVALMAGFVALMIWGYVAGDGADSAPPLGLVAAFVALSAMVIVGVLAALIQRIRELRRGEEREADIY